jgi:predicted RecA/RadA family phage recombinase
MQAQFIHDGKTIDYRPSTDLDAGSVVVVGDLVAITKRRIKAGELGVLHTTGVFRVPKQIGAGKAIVFGKKVYWHLNTNEVRDTASGGKAMGKAVQETGDNDVDILVRLGDAD